MRSRLILKGTAALTALLMAGYASVVEAALSAPSLTATAASASQINLSWTDPNPNESGQQVERSLSQTTGFTIVATLGKNVTSFSSTGLAASTRYYFRVKATSKGNGGSPYSNVVSATTLAGTAPPPSGVPAAPSNLTASAYSSTQINVSWTDNSSNETAFKVERATSSGGPFAQIGTTAGASWADSGRASSTTYYYRARAYNASGDSAYTNTAGATTSGGTGVPPAPSGLSASSASASQINLSWSDLSSNESGFKVERSTAATGWAQIGTTGVNVRTFSSTGLTAGTAYSYRVRAYNTSGDSGYSNTASATPTGTAGSRWSRRVGSNLEDRGQAVAVDGQGRVLMTGSFAGTTDFGGGLVSSALSASGSSTLDIFVAGYSSSGGYLWKRVIGSTGDEAGMGVAADDSGNVLVTGYQFSYAVDYGGGPQYLRSGSDIFIAKYSSAGSWVWSKTIGGTGYDQGYGVSADPSGNVFMTGYMSATGVDFGGGALSSAGQEDAFLVKYSPTGAHLWSKRFGSTGSDVGMSVATDAAGNVFVMGHFQGTVNFGGTALTSAGIRDVFVAKYSATGAHLWSKRFGGSGDDLANGLAVSAAGNVALSGSFQGSINFGGSNLTSAGGNDAFLAQLTGAAGGHLWSKRFGSTSADIARAVAVDGSDNVIVSGYFAGAVDFGGGALSSLGIDVFAAKYSSSGTHLWSRRYGGAGNQFGYGVAAAPNGDVTLTGLVSGTIDFGTGVLTSLGMDDVYVAAIGP